jgi:hypothetical protein
VALEYLPVTIDEMPVRKLFDIEGENYLFEFRYNDVYDFISMYIFDSGGELLLSTKLCYLTNALHAVCPGLAIKARIVPLNEIDAAKQFPEIDRMGADNFPRIKVCLV